MKKLSKFTIVRIAFLIIYIICVAVLIVESCMDGSSSANQSNAVGGAISGIINDAKGDQTISVNPTSVVITNDLKDNTINGKTSAVYQLTYKTIPENATYQSYIFTSDNENIATVNEKGLIIFKGEGTTNINIINENFKNVKTSVTVKVTDIKVDDVELWIETEQTDINNPIYDSDNNTYSLFVNHQYIIKHTIYPVNATNKSIIFNEIDNEYLSLSNDGYITTKGITTETITITAVCACGEINKNIKVIIIPTEIIEFDSIYLNDDNNTLETIVTKTISASIIAKYKVYDLTVTDGTFIESTKSYSNFKLTTMNTDLISINNNKMTGLKAGTATITATSLEDESKEFSFQVIIKPQENVSSYFVPSQKKYYIKEETTSSINITLSGDQQYYLINSYEYISSNDEVVKIDNSKSTNKIIVFKLLKTNSEATITVKINGISKNINIITSEPEESKNEQGETVIVQDYNITKNDNLIFEIGNPIDLSKLYTTEWIDTNGSSCKAPNGIFTYSASDESAISGTLLTPNAPGIITITIHFEGYTDKTFDIYVVGPYQTKINNETYDNDEININVNDSLIIEVISESYKNQSYDILHTHADIFSCYPINSFKHQLTSNNSGKVNIVITPTLINAPIEINEFIKANYSTTLCVNMEHIYVNSILVDATLTNHSNKTSNYLFDKSIYLNDTLTLNVILESDSNLNPTISEIKYISSDESILKISNDGEVELLKTGFVTITIKDNITGETWERNIKIINLIEIDENQQITILGVECEYDEKNKLYKLLNGHPGTIIVNFTESSTYTTVTYKSSDEKVLTVGKDGKITTLKAGKSTVTITCDDGSENEPQKIFTIDIQVKRQNAIKDLKTFFYKIRKSLGHFGAFLVMGIFSTLTYLLFFRKKHWIWSVPLNIAQGFGIAALTEYIQTFIPGRAGRLTDVYIDFYGFLFSSIILTVGILAYYFIKYLRQKSSK